MTVASASLIACSLPLLGMTAANAAPIDGAPSIGDTLFAGIGNTGYDVLHYDVKLDYTFDGKTDRDPRSVVATTTITANAPVELGTFSLDFEGMTVDSVTVNGAPALVTRSSDASTESYKLHIVPAAPVVGDFTVAVNYSGIPTEHIDNDGSSEGWVPTPDGAIALGQPVGTMAWLPSNNTPADKATFDLQFTVPTTINGKPAAAVSNGEMVGKTVSGDGLETTWQWKQLNQQATMSTIVGIGNYDIFTNDITLTDGRVIPEWSFVDSNMSSANKERTEVQRLRIQEVTQFLESKYGPYPGNSTGLVADPSDVGYALETQDRSYFPSVPNPGTLVHEMAHQWYGAAVTPADWNSIWISEGQASYGSNFYNEGHAGAATKTTYFNMWSGTAASHARWTVPTAAMTDQRQLFDWQTYNRGGMTYEALRQVVGEEVFIQILTGWPQEHNGTSQVTAGFIAYAQEVSGKDLTAFFQDWLYDADKPAWPSVWNFALSADPAGSEVAPGSEITYSLDATNAGQVPLGGTVTLDLADILDDAVIDTDGLDPSLTLDGTTLTWAVPAVTGTDAASQDFTVTLNDRAYGATLDAAAALSLGGFCADACATSHTTAVVPTITEADLTDDNRGDILLPKSAIVGEKVEIILGNEDLDGAEAQALLFSEPTDLGTHTVTGEVFTVQIPANATPGAHKIAVLDSIGLLVGWGDITLKAVPSAGGGDADGKTDGKTDGKNLAGTGSDGPALWITGGAAALLILAGGALLIARQRQTR